MRSDVSEVFSALADDTRRAIYEQLLAHPGGLTATQLAKDSHVSRQAIVKHLQLLGSAGLARSLRDGRDVLYLATPKGTERASQWLVENGAAWDRRLATLRKNARAPRSS